MFTTQDFLKQYRTFSNAELVTILNNKKDYQISAIEAARLELERRQLSQEEMNEAVKVVQEAKNLKIKKREKILTVEHEIKSSGRSLLETLNPISDAKPSNEKTIISISVVFGIFFIFQLANDSQWIGFFIEDFTKEPMQSINILLPFVTLPIAVFTFWRRKKIGWILLTAYLTYSSLWALRNLIDSFTMLSSKSDNFDNLFPTVSPMLFIIQSCIFIGALYLIARSTIRQTFRIDKNKMILTILISWIVTFLFILMDHS